ncbi:zinc finger protein 567-like [Leguminivora glycinivorella]|uniref:zinc finger protein 567-like n=1 Tax=Leguminivora glycinivorella TaxID=1035111 RepID=UPI00200C2972|nr:zinc finger protein 567-like [Leguminivora glycinivorella]
MTFDIKLEAEDLEICRGCLSSDRSLSPVATKDLSPLLTEDQALDLDRLASVTLCWECLALLRRTYKFQRQVQRAHMIQQDSLQLLPPKPSLSSLSVHQNVKYDVVLEETAPTVLYSFYESPEYNKVIIPTKYKNIQKDSSIQKGNIKIEHPNDFSDAEDMSPKQDDGNISSKEGITETKPVTLKSLQIEKTPKSSKETSALLKVEKELKKKITKQKMPIKRNNSIEKCSVQIKINNANNIDNTVDVEKDNNDNNQVAKAIVASKRKNKVEKVKDPNLETEDFKEKGNLDSNKAKITQNEIPFKDRKRSKKTKKLKYKKIFTKYKKVEDVLQYFEEIEMSQDDLKMALEKDDAIVDKKYPVKCSICGMMLMYARSLDAHAYRYHRKNRPDLIVNKRFVYPPLQLPEKSVWRCRACARAMRREHVLAHMNWRHTLRYYCVDEGCELHQKEHNYFWEREDCVRHFDAVHKQCACALCGRRYRKKSSLEIHIMESHRPPQPQGPAAASLRCRECGASFRRRAALRRHRRRHRPERRYCVECDATFKNDLTFRNHCSTFHSGEPRPLYPCGVCGKVMKTKRSLTLHVNYFHVGVTSYRCHICGKYLIDRYCLKLHVDKHNNIVRAKKPNKLVPCTVCGRNFQHKGSLRVHMNTHTGERPYACPQPQCAAAFTQPFVLRVHLARAHAVHASVRASGDIVPVHTDVTTV